MIAVDEKSFDDFAAKTAIGGDEIILPRRAHACGSQPERQRGENRLYFFHLGVQIHQTPMNSLQHEKMKPKFAKVGLGLINIPSFNR